MRTSTLTSSILLILGLFISQALSANTTSTTPNAVCATIYTEPKKGGSSAQVCRREDIPAAFSKNVSSILVPAGYNMRLFKQAGFKGQWIDIVAGLWNAPAAWNNSVVSVYYNKWASCATFYDTANQKGTSFRVCTGGVIIPGYNDKIASVEVPTNQSYRLFKENNFTGDWIDVTGKTNLPANFVNKVGSMRLQFVSNCATAYTGQNKTGNSLLVCVSSNSLPTGFDNAINSIDVPKNLTLTVYQNANYTGASLKIASGVWNAPANWTNVISSIKYSNP